MFGKDVTATRELVELNFLEQRSHIRLALAIAGALMPHLCPAQLSGQHTNNTNPLRTTQPICDSDRNDGLDIAVPVGTPVFAPSSGIISAVWNDKIYGCGLSVMVNLPDGAVAGFTWLSDTMVYIGEPVKQGQIIAHSGKAVTRRSRSCTTPCSRLRRARLIPGQGPRQHRQKAKKRLTDPVDLQKAIDSLNASDESDYTKTQGKQLLVERFYKDRALADSEYKDNLKKALDAWYVNGKNWEKIPPDVWAKLNKADQARMRRGIDPLLPVPVPISK